MRLAKRYLYIVSGLHTEEPAVYQLFPLYLHPNLTTWICSASPLRNLPLLPRWPDRERLMRQIMQRRLNHRKSSAVASYSVAVVCSSGARPNLHNLTLGYSGEASSSFEPNLFGKPQSSRQQHSVRCYMVMGVALRSWATVIERMVGVSDDKDSILG